MFGTTPGGNSTRLCFDLTLSMAKEGVKRTQPTGFAGERSRDDGGNIAWGLDARKVCLDPFQLALMRFLNSTGAHLVCVYGL